MKSEIQTLYSRILEDLRAELAEAETLYLRLCRAATCGLMRTSGMDMNVPVPFVRRVRHLSAQYRGMLQTLVRDVRTVYRNPIRVFPVWKEATLLDTLETYNAQIKELERIIEQLFRESAELNGDHQTEAKIRDHADDPGETR